MSTSVLRRIREAVWHATYEITIPHFLEELAADDLTLQDAETAILTGEIAKRLKGDPRGLRYVVRGRISDGRLVEIVARIKPDNRVLFITVYEVE